MSKQAALWELNHNLAFYVLLRLLEDAHHREERHTGSVFRMLPSPIC